ncbi:uncharacterized protein LOC110448363 [Mizuhopecten yessoensis]|uniref:uncharacterized protein LOC110448363 n=1 Tax=Mizuhopecten yessoensis TaxID=6573 RepID=UPI000B45BBF0|nr:uncharacterized protein LOC110448363 [Mizuhopecten yessoensis]
MLRDKLHNKQIVLKDESDVPLVLKTSPTVMIPTENQKDTPTIRLSRGHYRFTEGNVAILKCVVVATADTESIQWFRVKDGESHAIIIDNEKYFGGSLKSPSLAIADVKKSDRGIYFCRTRNRAGEVESEIAFVEINCIVKDASQLSQPSQTRRPSTVTNTIIKKQFAMASNVNDEVATLHNTMVFNIRTEMFGDQLEKVKCLFEDNPLTPLDMFEIKNIQTLFERLMNYETIDYGDYQKFVSAIRCIHPKVCSMVQECAVKINKLKGNLDDQEIHPDLEPMIGESYLLDWTWLEKKCSRLPLNLDQNNMHHLKRYERVLYLCLNENLSSPKE